MFGMGGGRRDEELWATLLRWLGQIMMNFTVGDSRQQRVSNAPAVLCAGTEGRGWGTYWCIARDG